MAALLSVAGAAHAQVYAGTSLGLSRLDLDCSQTEVCDRQGSVLRLFAGYMHTPYLGAEASYYRRGVSRIEASTPAPDQLVGDISGSGLGLYAVAVAPFDEAALHVKVGLYSSYIRLDAPGSGAGSSSERHAAFAWALGGSYALGPRWRAQVDIERLQVKLRGQRNHLDMVTGGLAYRF